MSNDKKFIQAITARDENFAQWYTDVVKEAKLCDYTSVKGCLIYEPNGYAIWENIQNNLDKRFKATGVQNVYLPLLIPESLLQKEADHIEGFAPEVAWVTRGGLERLEEKLCIRPTSEVLFCDHWAKTVKSYRDLPKIYNQWNSVLRWEKTTRPFLRSREFLWQEGHTIHATAEEAKERTLMMLEVYRDFVVSDLAIPLICGRKTDSEKFAGAKETYTIEAMMHDGKALQSGTSHFFGNGFADAFDIKYLNKNNELSSVHETSWGLSTRIIGALIMVHGDDSGLVLPPRIAPTQVRVIPIAQHKEGVIEKAQEIVNTLLQANIRVDMDTSDKTPGWKFSEQEMLGIPARIEIGPKDIENNTVVIVRRDTREKITVAIDAIQTELPKIFEEIQANMYNKAEKFLNEHIDSATTLEEMITKFTNKRGFIKAMWCGSEKCEDEIKYETGGAGSRCIPFEEEHLSDTCIYCGKPAKHMVIWGKSY
ncbi:MAG: proline--tRNA ligase [Bacilli bacterium]|nr:proline--tRNA ligase [Bacilli bacterium]